MLVVVDTAVEALAMRAGQAVVLDMFIHRPQQLIIQVVVC